MELGGKFYTEKDLKSVGFKKIGKNVKIHSRSSIYGIENISIGNNVRIDDFSIVIASGPVNIGSYVHIANFCYLGGTHGIDMEDFSGLSPKVMLFSSSDDYSGNCLTNPTVPLQYTGGKKGKVVLKKHVIIGAGSVVLPDCTIGEGSSIGALSLVTKNLDSWSIYSGIPAKKIKSRSDDLLKLEKQLIKEFHSEN